MGYSETCTPMSGCA